MFCALRAAASRPAIRSFSTSVPRAADLSKLVLIGHLARDPETRQTKNDKEFVTYTVATQNYPPPPPDANGERRPSTATFHRVLSFQEHSNRYLQTLKKGSKVYVEAGFELREPEMGADPTTPQGQRQIFLRHETIRVLSRPKVVEVEDE
ncbi:Single-stranded DNA-binding protein rim1, mitochondrial [Hypsizygus marmoreus]|uniref:Single-stranded DNA-binding protein rim1, mitochondrial n=1 Tax=Hypsizygus marmoreus TaxID=39966 RepID=A0A369JGT2_HYPMA|nr:Single-stranded DNA-binding protein rim1, mitochondrial [Hypsizygus marmoreus]